MSVGPGGSLYTVTLQHGPVTSKVTIDQPQVDMRFNCGVATRDYARVHFKAVATVDVQIAATADIAPEAVDIPLLSFEVPIVVTGGTVKLNLGLSLHVGADGSAILVVAARQRGMLACWGERFWRANDGALSTGVPEAVPGITTAQ